MDTLLLIYFVALSMELVLSLGMLVLLWLIIAPRGAERIASTGHSRQQPTDLPPTPEAALRAAFNAVSRGNDETAVLVHARQMLARAAQQEG